MNLDSFKQYMLLDCKYPYDYVTGEEDLGERFRKIRHNYEMRQKRVEIGISEWERGDPYAMADWARIFSPIEYDAWCEIRAYGLPLWPQLPVGKFFADFGNPVHKVILECDGKAFHNAIDDAERDFILRRMGWRVFRVTGAQCYKTRTWDSEVALLDKGEEVPSGYQEKYERETIVGTIKRLKGILLEGKA